jgi:hypothetical protein
MDGPAVPILIAIRLVAIIPRRQANRILASNFLLNPTARFAESTLYRISY